jgi:hypothetical protein
MANKWNRTPKVTEAVEPIKPKAKRAGLPKKRCSIIEDGVRCPNTMSRGLVCRSHYDRKRSTGSYDKPPPKDERCEVIEDGIRCENPATRGAVCNAHGLRMQRYGSYSLPPKPEKLTRTCSTPGCDKPVKTNGLCHTCYVREWRKSKREAA